MEINATTGATGTATTESDRGLSSLKSEDFFKILVTELQQQDPMEPADTSQMINQVSQIRSIELSDKLNTTLDRLASGQQAAGVSGLIGKFVSAALADSSGNPSYVEGVVTGVRFESDGTTVLELDTGQAVRAEDVNVVTTLEALESYATSTDAQDAKDGTAKSTDAKQQAAAKQFKPLTALGTLLGL